MNEYKYYVRTIFVCSRIEIIFAKYDEKIHVFQQVFMYILICFFLVYRLQLFWMRMAIPWHGSLAWVFVRLTIVCVYRNVQKFTVHT